MAKAPFRTSTSLPKTPHSAEEQPSVPQGKRIVQTVHEGVPLPVPSQNTAEGTGHGHSPRIPWPPAQPLEHNDRPFKLKE